MKRRAFIKNISVVSVATGLLSNTGYLASNGQTSQSDLSVNLPTRSWSEDYARIVVIDALASPIQFNIPQSGFPLSKTDREQVRHSGITALNLTVNRGGADNKPFESTLTPLT